MKSYKLISSVFVLIGSFACSHATAAVYKCTSLNNNSNQSITIYTDVPCGAQNKQSTVDIQPAPINPTITPDESALGLAITRAVLTQGFKQAKSLAKSKEHWRLISLAQEKRQTSIRTAPVVPARVAARDACAGARGDFESTSRTRWRNKDLIATKKSVMFAACGVVEPVQQYRSTIIGRSYGGIQSSRWIAPPYGRKGYHRPYCPQHKRHRAWHVRSKSGLSLNYKSKSFGLRAQGVGTQKHTNIRQQFR